jgi:uncharacterized protein
MYAVHPKQTLSMQTRDRLRLDADVYYPDAAGEFPILLMRQPYGRAIASTVVYAHPIWYAAHGYIVVVQDVRGRGTSEGSFQLFEHEVEDGYDSVEWAATLPQSNGKVGMYGFSYQGMTQLYAAAAHPPALKTICPSMIAYDLYQDWAYEGGAFCHLLNLAWALQLTAETIRRTGDRTTYSTIYKAAHQLIITDPVNLRSELLEQFDPTSFYHTWAACSDPDDPYWQRLSPRTLLETVDLPMLHIGGWFDTYLRGTWHLYKAMVDRAMVDRAMVDRAMVDRAMVEPSIAQRSNQNLHHLIVGPWSHLPWGRKVGAVDYGADANSPIDRLQVRWFDYFLKGIDTGILEESAIALFEMNSNKWCRFSDIEFANATYQKPAAFALVSDGLAAMREDAGQLVLNAQPMPFAIPDVWVHDPWRPRPVPTQGGHAGFPAGAGDRSALDCRTDMVTYTSEPFTTALHLVGELTVELTCAADTTSFDLCAVLSEVKPNGAVMNFSQGYLRVQPGYQPHQLIQVTISLQPTCIAIPPTHALRLSVSAACSPAYAVNPGTGKSQLEEALINARVITLSLFQGTVNVGLLS